MLKALNNGETIVSDSPLHEVMHRSGQETLRITAELNGSSYHEPNEARQLLASLTGKGVDKTVTMFPPFHTDLGENMTIGRRVFINSGCSFQDQGGIRIGDDSLIGHNMVLAILNHDISRLAEGKCTRHRSSADAISGSAPT